jgi:hypothetical protein
MDYRNLTLIDKFKLTHHRYFTWYKELLTKDYKINFIEGTESLTQIIYLDRKNSKT